MRTSVRELSELLCPKLQEFKKKRLVNLALRRDSIEKSRYTS